MAVGLLAWAAIVTVRVVRGAGSGPFSRKHLDGWTPIEPRLGEADSAEFEKNGACNTDPQIGNCI